MNSIHKYIIRTFAVSCTALLHSNSVTAHIASPPDRQSVEQEYLDRRYFMPISGIEKILTLTLRLCNRLPTQQEFKDFILNGSHKDIQCPEVIKTYVNLQKKKKKIGKNIPKLVSFLERNEHKVYSDTKKIFVILNIGPKGWKGKYFKSDDYAYVIDCTFGSKKCDLSPLDLQVRSCKASKTFAKKHCYFNGKKIIDY